MLERLFCFGLYFFLNWVSPFIHFSVITYSVVSAQRRRLPTTMQRREQTAGGISRDTAG